MSDCSYRKCNAKPTLGVVAISHNEEKDLPGFLEHLLPWVDEIVIVDDGSSDNTVLLADSAGEKVKVIQHKMTHEGGFSEQRNLGIDVAESDWLLNMDIDERVTPELAEEIIESIKDTTLNAFRYHRLNFFLHRAMHAGEWCSWNHPQLARRGFHRYVNKVHERCTVHGEPESVGQLSEVMWHLNDESYEERIKKSVQYSKIDSEKLIADNIRVKWYYLISKPLLEFVKIYIVKRGGLDGIPGLISAMHSACAVFRTFALVWDAQNCISREILEQEIKTKWENSEITSNNEALNEKR